jgi:Holliday junction resolvase RusA-like endonuclease
MKEIYFIVEGKVQPKQRPRVYRNKYTGRAQAVTPKETKEYERTVRGAFCEACEGEKVFFEGAVEMIVNIYVEVPKSTRKLSREAMLLGFIRPTVKNGDVDNFFKTISDSLNGIAYDDDSQIVEAVIRKFYAPFDKAEITIREVRE